VLSKDSGKCDNISTWRDTRAEARMAGEHTQQEAKYEKTKRASNMDAGKSIMSPDGFKIKKPSY
jgi:hypothetical protein